jgi:hypothetical protein
MICGSLPFASAANKLTVEPMALALMHCEEPPIPLRSRDPSVPEGLESLVLRALSKSPDDRPTADDLARMLIGAVDGIPQDATATFAAPLLGMGSSIPRTHGEELLEPSTRSMRRHPADEDTDGTG